ncbi:MAG TPA: ammonium transporter [Verrucomicrobiales bacterium]|nr:ammonium transporter [Verrucomicrobiales bacterium]
MKKLYTLILLVCFTLVSGYSAFAQDPPSTTPPAPPTATTPAAPEAVAPAPAPAPPALDPGHNAWQMTCTALVLFMTLPGLALFYGGLVRRKNVLSVLAQCLGIAGMVTILWWVCGYSLCFNGTSPYYGDMSGAFFEGINVLKTGAGSTFISDGIWVIFQLTFAIITPALIIGAIAERMKFAAVLAFVALWMFAVYFPLAHMVWGATGFMCGGLNAANAGIPALDFAGGTVVHMSSGFSALVLCILLGKRHNYGKEKMSPHSMVLCMVGTGMLWVGWYGFNAGSALAADGIAVTAFVTTTLAAGTAGFVWGMVEWIHRGKPSVLGFCSGVVAGLVVITPACGFVTFKSAMICGLLAGIVPYLAVVFLKAKLGYDDALDTFGVHGVGGTLGALLTGIFADENVNGVVTAVKDGLVMTQIKAILVTIVLSVVATTVITLIVKAVIGLRPSQEDETIGLDLIDHGEEGYHGA